MTEWTQHDLATLRQKRPEEILAILTEIEADIRHWVSQELGKPRDDEGPVGIPVLDWLVEQVLFLQGAWQWLQRSGLGEENIFWMLEMLSLLECDRRAQSHRRRVRLLEEALVKENLRWRDSLWHRRWKPDLEVWFSPRSLAFLPRQLTPYGSSVGCPKRWPNPWGYPLDLYLCFHAWVEHDSGPLLPYQRLQERPWMAFSLQVRMPNGTVILDIPRSYEQQHCLAHLSKWKALVEEQLRRMHEGSGAEESSLEGTRRWLGRLGCGGAWVGPAADANSLEELLRHLLTQLTHDLEQIQEGRLSATQRATIMQRYFALPGSFWLQPVRIVPLDLFPALLPVVLGAWLYLHGGLSVRERRRFHKFVEQHLLARPPHISASDASRLVPEVIGRIGRFERPLRGASVGSYLWQVVRQQAGSLRGSPGGTGAEDPGMGSEEDRYKEWSYEQWLDEQRSEEGEEPGSGVASASQGWQRGASRRLLKGALQRAAELLGCHPRTVARGYQRFCGRRGLSRGPTSWEQFRKHLRRNMGQGEARSQEANPPSVIKGLV